MQKIPASTYRLQLHKGFSFDDAASIADYLHDLGVTHIYCSPYLQAAPGSTHGYDVVDHTRVNEELGGAEGHQRFCKRLEETHLGQVLDIVPNHMALGKENRFWWDVLENGESSRYASFFDIDWRPYEERLRNKVLVPVLADQYGRVLQAGDIKIRRQGSRFLVEVPGQILPVAPHSLQGILARAAESAGSDLLSFLAVSYGRLPAPEFAERSVILARHRDTRVLNALLARLCAEQDEVCRAVDRAVQELNDDRNALDDFLNQQNFRLAYWKTADQQLGYRRFFDVNTLIGLRVEREHVFDETHALILDWLRRGVLDGVRVDHPDGLRDPLQYLRRLREHAPDAWIVAEKILEPGEFLRENWPIDGTSGYDFMNVVLGVLIEPEGMRALNHIYEDFTSQPVNFAAIVHDKKINVSQDALGSDVNRLTSLLVEICEANRDQRDFTRAEMRRALREIAACFAIYRSYVQPGRGEITDEDRQAIRDAVETAKANRPDIEGGLFDFIYDILTLKVTGKNESELLMRFQQFTPPVMAKGVEDTAFYCYNRLVAMNEVGGDPGSNGIAVEQFHAYQAHMQATHPHTMTGLSTHDTKRSDDVRARLIVLSEAPDEFEERLNRWSRLNNDLRAEVFKGEANHGPDRNTEYLLYQTMIGAWPITEKRLQNYMLKAVREAKQQTTWTANNAEFEDGLHRFVEAILRHEPFMQDMEQFAGAITYAGRVNSLAQTLMKHTCPGVPDLYQGGELWDLSLVDPDNRRPVDYEERRSLLDEVRKLAPGEAARRSMEQMDSGLPKMWTIHRALCLRTDRPEGFSANARYTPLHLSGVKERHGIAYLRADSVATIVPRLPYTLGAEWGDTTVELPEGSWLNYITGEAVRGGRIELGQMLREFPVAVLARR